MFFFVKQHFKFVCRILSKKERLIVVLSKLILFFCFEENIKNNQWRYYEKNAKYSRKHKTTNLVFKG